MTNEMNKTVDINSSDVQALIHRLNKYDYRRSNHILMYFGTVLASDYLCILYALIHAASFPSASGPAEKVHMRKKDRGKGI